MKRVKHPTIEGLTHDVSDSALRRWVAAGWVEDKPRRDGTNNLRPEPVIVSERRPEVYVENASGRILPPPPNEGEPAQD